MEPERSRLVLASVRGALAQPVATRDAWLAATCGGDAVLLGDLRNLLQAMDFASTFCGDLSAPHPPSADRPARAERPPVVGRVLGHYQLIEWLGAGGMGEVYYARDIALGREAALKLLPRRFDPHLTRRLRHEAEASAKLQHPSIATFFEAGEVGSETFIAMEFVRGRTLRSHLVDGPLPLGEAAAIAMSVLDALEHAHAAGILHRDVKPENIMVTAPHSAKLLDFGLASALRAAPWPAGGMAGPHAAGEAVASSIAGTLGYMAPEQLLGRPLDARTDVFQAGAVLYEMLSGVAAFPGASPMDRLAAVMLQDPDMDLPRVRELPAPLRDVLQRALARDPADRYADAARFRAALHKASRAEPLADREADELYERARRLLDGLGKGAAEQAIVLLDRVVAMAPSHAPAFVALANAYGFRSIATTDTGDLEKALGCANRAVQLDPNSHEAHTWRGYALMRQGRFADAADAYRRAAEIDPAHPAAFYFAGSNLLFGGRVGEALPLLQQAVALDPSLGMPWMGLGAAHLSRLTLAEAARCFARARDLEGQSHQFATAAASAYLGEAARLEGRLEEARTHALVGLESAERSDHAYRDTFRAYALVVLGCTALDQGQREPAGAAFGQVLAQAEGRPRTRSCGHLVVRALAGMAIIGRDVDVFREACRYYDERQTFNFEPFFGALDHQTWEALSAAAMACGLRQEADGFRSRARAALIHSG